jgi:subtilase family serine protease
VRVLNQGTGPSSATAINVKIGGDTIGQNHSIPLLQAGQTATVNFQDNLDVAQNYLVNVTVDPGNVVAESSEGNNSVSHSFTVSP